MNKKIIRIPKDLLEKEENIISNKEALKDVIPINWDEMIVKEETSEYIKNDKIDNKDKKRRNQMKKVDNYIENEKLFIDLEYDFIKALVDTRKSNHLTQQEVADNINIFREAIARIETNKVSPQLNTLIKILYSMGYKLEIVPIKEINDNN